MKVQQSVEAKFGKKSEKLNTLLSELDDLSIQFNEYSYSDPYTEFAKLHKRLAKTVGNINALFEQVQA